jgi:hypothetical protein
MRILLRIVVGLLGFVAFLGMMGSGALWAYGEYGAPLLETQLRSMEEDIEQELEDDHPGSTVTVEFKEVFYQLEGTSLFVAFEVHAVAELSGVEVENTTTYVSADILGVVFGEAGDFATYTVSEWDDVKDAFKAAPSIVFNGAEAKKVAITWAIIFGVIFVGSIVVRATLLRRKRKAA